MGNYQLYHTNIRMGGQMKWDLTIESGHDGLYINDFHLSPISDRAPFTYSVDNNLLNNSHLDNIKKYYQRNSSIFYKEYGDPILSSREPIVVNGSSNPESSLIDTHDDTLEMGLKRANYSVKKKQFEFFCPVWLEEYDPSKQLVFNFVVTSKPSDNNGFITVPELAIRTLKFNVKGPHQYHNKFIDYFNGFTKDVSISQNHLGDSLMRIQLKEGEAFVRGVDVATGLFNKAKIIAGISQSLLNTERLMMDFDNLLGMVYPDNHMVAPQLFNFNFIFDADDILPQNLLNIMYGSDLHMDVRVSYGEDDVQELPLLDFYTNYNFIPCKPIGISKSYCQDEINVFDLVNDTKNINLQDKNRSIQSIFHWSIKGNNDYIFNLYSGFGGYVKTKEESTDSTTIQINTSSNDSGKLFFKSDKVKDKVLGFVKKDSSEIDWDEIKSKYMSKYYG